MLSRRLAGILIAVGFGTFALTAAPHLPSAPEPASTGETICGRVLAVDLFNQTFLVQPESSQAETVPFSRWTDFVRTSAGHESARSIDPTGVHTGDRLCVVLDPSGATANRVEVLPARRATEMARACAK
jgi:hypothetical protein